MGGDVAEVSTPLPLSVVAVTTTRIVRPRVLVEDLRPVPAVCAIGR